MPKFKPLSIDEQIKRQTLIPRPLKHHSITDWDFLNVNWNLDLEIYHDAPPSFVGTGAGMMLIKHATTGALSDGRLILWLRYAAGNVITFYFRNQQADGNAGFANCYNMIVWATDTVKVSSYTGGVGSEVATKNRTWNPDYNTWYKLRLTWWTSLNRLYIRLERWTGTEWTTLGDEMDTDFEDTDDLYKDNPVNRCGFDYASNHWQDDVEVWG